MLNHQNLSKIAGVGSCFNPRFPPSTTLPLHTSRRRTLAWSGVATLLLLTGCREGFNGFGSGARARAAAEQLFDALADRHAEVVRNPKYEYARVRLTRGALSPSRVFDDSAAWTTIGPTIRRLESFGNYADGKYYIASRPGVPLPAKPADARHVTTLSRLSDNEYRWDASVDFALGSVRPSDVAAIASRLFAAGEARGERDARADLAATAPRTGAVMSALFSLDSLRPVLLTDGSTTVTLEATVRSDGLRRRYPAFADFVHKYIDPARYRLQLTDRAGVPFFDMTQKDRLVTMHLRTQHGHLVSLVGPARPMPDTLLLNADFKVKVKIFNVGFHDLQTEFVNSARGDQERDWTVTARKDPQWDLPMIIGRLIRAPLRRPFAGEGSQFKIGVRGGEGGAPTTLLRQTRLFVQESAILNWIN
ncbi:MAG: hypothetical protein JWN53_2309, partial [Gemmatimonadetes bacterium]|nr:hypothetical protein [Gemmatimonadota bacterium]